MTPLLAMVKWVLELIFNMKYIINESQYRFLKEQDQNWEVWFKRRANPESVQFFIDRAVREEDNPCENYSDEFQFAENIIDWSVNNFLSIDEEFFNSPEFEEYQDMLIDMCKEWFAEELFKKYRDVCNEQDVEVKL